MNLNRKVIFIVIIGVSACLLTFILSQYFLKKNHNSRLLLTQIQQLPQKVEYIRFLEKYFIQDSDQTTWRNMVQHMELIEDELEINSPLFRRYSQEIQKLKNNLTRYHDILNQIAALQLSQEKNKPAGVGDSEYISILSTLNEKLFTAGNDLQINSEKLSNTILGETLIANQLNHKLSWGFPFIILCGLAASSAILAYNIIHGIDNLKKSHNKIKATERNIQEQKMRENEKLLKDVIANLPGVVFKFESTSDHLYKTTFLSDKRVCEIFGVKADSPSFNDEFYACIPENDKKAYITSIKEAVDGITQWNYEGRFIKPGGEKIWFSGNAIAHKIDQKIIFYGVLLDTTQAKKLEESLGLTQFIFERAAVGIHRIGSNAKILDANDQAARMLGYTKEELCTLSIFDIDPFANANRQGWEKVWQRLCEKGSDSFETVHLTKDGREIPIQINSNLIEYDNQQFSIAFAQDISDRKQAEKETKRLEKALMQAQKMEAIGTLAGGIAHDFNNILSAVIGFSELSLSMTEVNSSLHKNIQRVITAGVRARDLVEQILTFSREDERELTPLQVSPLVRESLKLLRSSLPSNINISQQIARDTNNVMADPTQIHQVIMNLCTNAAHAMEKNGGQLNVSLTQVTLSKREIRLYPGLRAGDYLNLCVQDTGHGIQPEIIEKIYEPYFTTKEKGKGTGLGLAVVHGIVKSYGGAMDVYSELHKGTTFSIYLPAVKEATKVEEKIDFSLPDGNEHIMLIDDESALIDIGQKMLEKRGYHVSTVNDSEEALKQFRQTPYSIDLVLTDMTMPKITGDKLSEEMLKIRPDLPIILCTGYSGNISSEKAIKIGIKAFIQKPILEEDLARIVRKTIDESKKRSKDNTSNALIR